MGDKTNELSYLNKAERLLLLEKPFEDFIIIDKADSLAWRQAINRLRDSRKKAKATILKFGVRTNKIDLITRVIRIN